MAWGSDIDVEALERTPYALAFSKNQSTYGKLCFCSRAGDDSGKLIYVFSNYIKIWCSWPPQNRDLDLLVYWAGHQSEQSRGWSNATGPMELVVSNKTFFLAWSGDRTGHGGDEHGEEWFGIKPLLGEQLMMHFNYYGSQVDGAPISDATCTVKMMYIPTGDEVSLGGLPCNTRRHEEAIVKDPYASIQFRMRNRTMEAAIVSQGGNASSWLPLPT